MPTFEPPGEVRSPGPRTGLWIGIGAVIIGIAIVAAAIVLRPTDQQTGSAADPTAPSATSAAPTTATSSLPVDENVAPLTDSDIAKQYGGAVFRIASSGCSADTSGSGFAISSTHIVTNRHVVANDMSPTIYRLDGSSMPGQVIGLSESPDVAVIKVSQKLDPVLAWSETSALTEGQHLVAMGYPVPDLAFSVTPGAIVSFKTRGSTREVIRSDGAFDRGNSGGPAVVDDGTVAGVITEMADNSDGFQLVPLVFTSDAIRPTVESFIADPGQPVSNCGDDLGPETMPEEWSEGPEGEGIVPGEESVDQWIAVLASVPDTTPAAEVEQRYDEVAARVPGPNVLSSSQFASLKPGYWVVFVGGFATGDDVISFCASYGLTVPHECYGRILSHNPADAERIAQ